MIDDSTKRKLPPSHRKRFAVAVILALACIGATTGDVLYVKRVSMPIRNGKFAFNTVVATAVQGDSVTVTGTDGKWLKVQYTIKGTNPGETPLVVEGWVFEDALDRRAVAVATTGPTGTATEVGAAGAARPVLPVVLNAGRFAQAKGLSPDSFYKMVADSNASVSSASFDAFTKAGRIGPYKPNPTTVPANK